MRLDARIPVHVVPSVTRLPEADPQALLLLAQPGPPELSARGAAGGAARWMAVRHLAGDVAAAAPHPAGCPCCVVRGPLALLLSSLFEQRARGTLGLFRRVWLVAPPALAEAVPALLEADPLAAGRYRVGES